MNTHVYVIGTYTTPFSKWVDRSFKDLTRQAYMGALADAGLQDGVRIDAAWFGNCLMSHFGQTMIGGNVCFVPLVREGLFPDRAPIINVEAGCSTGTLTLQGAATAIRAGDADLTVALGVEKLVDPDNQTEVFRKFSQGLDCLDPQDWQEEYSRAGDQLGMPFEPGPDRTVPMDTYAMQARYHMSRFGTTQEQIAAGAAKNHNNGALNPNAHYRFEMTPQQVMQDRMVVDPLTRSMCAPMTDGAAAALVCSESFFQTLSPQQKDRAIRLRAIGLSGGKYRNLEDPSLTATAAQRAYERAGIGARDIDVAEVHDATSFCEVYQVEMMGFCPPGEGGAFVGGGETALTGSLPVNTSGGLVSKGHPIGATGLSMCAELVTQLRGEAGARQVDGATLALQENGGGIIGFDEALAAVAIYERFR
ncbi:thiolase family protein [Sulfitobacter sp. F26204]|uniref:thiolase family protein n=1 Tax=Sulfitobacter sp. F26204 TaxID=2996014 RepID=UPI00225DF670|nr:thiolase family protein [Sulfitobacter sp. F26204]MCX7561657.1 thiolase family protein [Sulfitobacter sp. F26204]